MNDYIIYSPCIKKRKISQYDRKFLSDVLCACWVCLADCVWMLLTFFSKALQRLAQDKNELIPQSTFCIKWPHPLHQETQTAVGMSIFRELRKTTSPLPFPFQGNSFLSQLNHSFKLPNVWLKECCNFLSFRIGGSKVTVLLEQFFFSPNAGVHSVKVVWNDCMFAFDSGLTFHPVISWCC